MSEDKEPFVSRWSRLKTEAREAPKEEAAAPPAPPAVAEGSQAPALPPVEQLTPESDFAPFMGPKVDQETRRAALKKLFADAHFNVPERFEAYMEDYTDGASIPATMLEKLERARKLLADEAGKPAPAGGEKPATPEVSATPQAPESPSQGSQDGARRQDA